MADENVVAAARTLKSAHIRADVLGGEHTAALSRAYDNLLAAVGDVEEPAEVTAYRADVVAMNSQPAILEPSTVPVAEGQVS